MGVEPTVACSAQPTTSSEDKKVPLLANCYRSALRGRTAVVPLTTSFPQPVKYWWLVAPTNHIIARNRQGVEPVTGDGFCVHGYLVVLYHKNAARAVRRASLPNLTHPSWKKQ
jgi:hypothetical protein